MGVSKGWSIQELQHLEQSLETVLLEEWGGPRSPLALEYLKKTIIPDIIYCLRANEDLLTNSTFTEIIAWKLKNQFAYPIFIVNDLAKDLIHPAQQISSCSQVNDSKEPWQRIFRLWVAGESLINIAERTGYSLDYLELLVLRYKKIKAFLTFNRSSLLECMQHSEFKEFGLDQLSFLYQFHTALTQETLFKERLILEQVISDLGLSLQVSDLISLLEMVHAHEGKLQEAELILLLRQATGNMKNEVFILTLEGLISLHYVLKNKAGYLTLSEKGAQIISGFLLPKISQHLKQALAIKDFEQAQGIIRKQNPEVLVKLIDWMGKNLDPNQILQLLEPIYKNINRRIDLQILNVLALFESSLDFLLSTLSDHDSLLRAKACEALGRLGSREAIFRLIQLLRDPVAEVKAKAAFALGEIGSSIAIKELQRITEDYSENLSVRDQAREALKKISNQQKYKVKNS